MPPTPQKPPESHYDLNKLHKIFAFAALTLLIALLALFAKDYSKEWKVYQQQFRELDAEKAKVKLNLLKLPRSISIFLQLPPQSKF